jgi:hypothetical protein
MQLKAIGSERVKVSASSIPREVHDQKTLQDDTYCIVV